MDNEWVRGPDDSQEWQALITAMELSAERPTSLRFGVVCRLLLEWAAQQQPSPRGSTSNSVVDMLVYKENTPQTRAVDHLGREVVPDESGGYTTEGTPDESLAVDANDQG